MTPETVDIVITDFLKEIGRRLDQGDQRGWLDGRVHGKISGHVLADPF